MISLSLLSLSFYNSASDKNTHTHTQTLEGSLKGEQIKVKELDSDVASAILCAEKAHGKTRLAQQQYEVAVRETKLARRSARVSKRKMEETIKSLQQAIKIMKGEKRRKISDMASTAFKVFLQQGDGSQPLGTNLNVPVEFPMSNSMPERFLALLHHGVTVATNGRDNKVVHALIKRTVEAIGENLAKYRRVMSAGKGMLIQACCLIISAKLACDTKNKLNNNVSITNFICGNFKRIHQLKYAHHMSLLQIYELVVRSNNFFRLMQMPMEYQMIAQLDLQAILGVNPAANALEGPLPLLHPVDIRNHFAPVPPPSLGPAMISH